MIKPVLLLGAIMASAACGSDSTAASAVAGNYTATTFLTGSTGQTNQLTLGSTLTLNLASNGTVSGHLHTAASGGNAAVDADMAGTWTQSGSVIDFTQAADTFVTDMLFTVATAANGVVTLAGDQVFVGGRVQVIMTRV